MNPKKYMSFLVVLIILLACTTGFAATYTHDNANRLTSIDYGDGTTITYTYDANGNMTSMSVNDIAAPTGAISINNGAASTSTTSVTLTLSATDNSGTVSQMRFSNDNATWSAWETYLTTKAWTLTDGSGTKTVYAEN